MQQSVSTTGWKPWARMAGQALAVLVMVPPVLAQKPAPARPAAPAAPATTLDRIRQSGAIRLGYRTDARPFSYDEAGKPAGYSIAVCQEVAGAIKTELSLGALNIEWVPVTLDDRFAAVQQGRVDLLCGADTETLARMKDVAFSKPIFPGGIGALVRSDASARFKDILNGHHAATQPSWRASASQLLQTQIFAVMKGTTAETWVRGKLDEFRLTSKVVPVESYAAGVQEVLAGKASAFFADRAILLDAAARNPAGGDLEVLERLFTYEPLALAFQRGDEDFRLAVDRALSGLYASGKILPVYKQWFGVPDAGAIAYFRWNTVPD